MRAQPVKTLWCSAAFCLSTSSSYGVHGRRKPQPHVAFGRRRSLKADEGAALTVDASSSLSKLPPIPKPTGDDSCPCLSVKDLASDFPPVPLESESVETYLGSDSDPATFGIGCAPHGLNATMCSTSYDACMTTVPQPHNCDNSSCARPWCYVDPRDCGLLHSPSVAFRGRHYSYATCGYMDSFTDTERLASLVGKTFRVALNSNSGGWKGAYHPEGSFSFDERWSGPIVSFVTSAALEGKFSLNVMRPPLWLQAESEKYFGKSSFDYCVYAAALGYVDLCVAAYTVTDKRASVTSFFETSDNAIYLVVFKQEGGATWESFWISFLTIFQPFTLGAWLLILLFCLPVLGLLMFIHEYGAPGSAYPRTVPVALQDVATGKVTECTARGVPISSHLITSVYRGFLAFFQESYDQSVVTIGGKINIIATSSFILMVLAVYTANLAAILTTDITKTSVASIEEAVAAGYNFCSERKVGQAVIELHNIDPSLIVPDPFELGGDGMPGFNCPDCNARQRVFQYMRQAHTNRSRYCNAAFASWEDLQVLHQSGEHCDKTKIGEVLAYENTGIPLYDGVSTSLLALFHRMKADGRMESELSAAEPESQCPVQEGEGNALTVEQLTGIWMITFSLAVVALVARLGQRCSRNRRLKATAGTRIRTLQRYDQWGNPTDHDVFIGGKLFDPNSVKNDFYRIESTRRLMKMVSTYPLRREKSEDVGSEQDDNDELFEDETLNS